jgi:hypothetical protein
LNFDLTPKLQIFEFMMSRFDTQGDMDTSQGGKPRRRSTGRLYGARNYSKQMVTTLLDSVENILPIEQEEWQAVADQFNYQFSVSAFFYSVSPFLILNFVLCHRIIVKSNPFVVNLWIWLMIAKLQQRMPQMKSVELKHYMLKL